jgi:hypothetical protein
MALSNKQIRQVKRWMATYCREYANPTLLAEACGDELQLYEDVKEWKIDEDVYDIALNYYDGDNI